MSDTNRWDEIDSIVAQHKRALKKATSHEPLKAFAKEQGFDNKQDFGKYKVSLRKIGVDYNELREETFKKRDEEQKKKTGGPAGGCPHNSVVGCRTRRR